MPLAERATVKRLVAEDNRDRDTLYAEIAKANGHPEWKNDIQQDFARRWVERGPGRHVVPGRRRRLEAEVRPNPVDPVQSTTRGCPCRDSAG